jgi:hypothetical protein
MLWFLLLCAQGTRQVRIMKKLLVIIALTTTLAFPALPAETSTIIVYRPWTSLGMLGSISFNVDHGPPIKIGNGTYVRLPVEPGEHQLSRNGLLGKDTIVLRTEPGQTVYVDAHYGLWVAVTFEVADDQTEAARDCAELKAYNPEF